MTVETPEEYLARGGKVTKCPTAGSQPQPRMRCKKPKMNRKKKPF